MIDGRGDLIIRIKRTFRKVPFPGRNIGDKDEFQRVRGKRWEELSVEDLNYDYEIGFFGPDGLRYYLPAYLIALLEHPDKASSNIRDAVIRDVGLCSGCPRLFTPAERALIAEFFQRYADFFPGVPDPVLPARIQAQVRQSGNESSSILQQAILNWKTN